MSDYPVGALNALGIGVLTSVHPCGLATNIAAVSFLCTWAGNLPRTLAAGLLYIFGRVFAYVCLGTLISYGALSVPQVANLLQQYANRLLGPCLILAGMLLSGLIGASKRHASTFVKKRWADMANKKIAGSFLMGALLAVSFCPVSAGLFFAVLIPLAVSRGSGVLYPAAYGLGTGVPVLIVVILAATGITTLQRKLTDGRWLSHWLPKGAGGVLIVIGIFYTLDHLYQLL